MGEAMAWLVLACLRKNASPRFGGLLCLVTGRILACGDFTHFPRPKTALVSANHNMLRFAGPEYSRCPQQLESGAIRGSVFSSNRS
jgi:hypothetical protein